MTAQDEDPPIGLLPALPGTTAHCVEKDGSTYDLPVVGWLVPADGFGTALLLTGDGLEPEGSRSVSYFDHPSFGENLTASVAHV